MKRVIIEQSDGSQVVCAWVDRPDGSKEDVAVVMLSALDAIATPDGVVLL